MPGEAVSFDPEYKSGLLTEFYANLFKATEIQDVWPTWVRLDDKFKDSDLQGMPRIDGHSRGRRSTCSPTIIRARMITWWRKCFGCFCGRP